MSDSSVCFKSVLIIVLLAITICTSYAQNLNKINTEFIRNSNLNKKDEAKWERQRINSAIIDKSGKAFEGQILYLNDSIVYQYLSHDIYQPENLLSSIVKFNVNDIEQINIYRKGQTFKGLKQGLIYGSLGTLFLTFITEESAWGRMWNLLGSTVWVMPASALTGVIIGSGRKIDVQFELNERNLSNPDFIKGINKYSLFPINKPSALLLSDSIKDVDLPKTVEYVKPAEIETTELIKVNAYNDFNSPMYISKLHFEFGVGLSANYRNNVLKNDLNKLGYFESAIRDPLLNDIKLDLGFSYQIKDHLRIGFNFYPKSYWTEGSYEKLLDNRYSILTDAYSYGSSTIVGANYVFKPVNRILNRRFEMFIGMGIVSNSITIKQNVSIAELTEFSISIYESTDLDFHKNIWGTRTQLQFDYYVTRNFSIYLNTAAFYLPSLHIPEIKVHSDYLNRSGTLEAHQTNISTIDVSFGLQVHF